MFKIMGIDQSLNSSGKVIMTLDEEKNLDIVDVKFYGYHQTKKRCLVTDNIHIRHLPKDWTKIGLIHRISWITNYLMEDTEGVKYMSMEDLAYGKLKQKKVDTNSILQLAQVAGSLKVAAFDRGMGVIAYNIDQNKNFATGDGKAGKPAMCQAWEEMFPQWFPEEFKDNYQSPVNDIADAFWLCEVLRCHIKYDRGYELDSTTKGLLEFSTSSRYGSLVETRMEIRDV